MSRYKVRIAYDGYGFYGWQSQIGGNTIQDAIEAALLKALRKETPIVGCGRTDAGVHALDYLFHFDSEVDFDPINLKFKLNKILDERIAIHSIEASSPSFHARFDAISRSYKYYISFTKNPFQVGRVWYYPYSNEMNIDKLNEMASLLMGYTSFKSFSKSKTDVKTFDCSVSKSHWKYENDLLVFHITANRFLRGMVRLIVGACINIERDKLSLEDVVACLTNGEILRPAYSVPAEGLYLTDIKY